MRKFLSALAVTIGLIAGSFGIALAATLIVTQGGTGQSTLPLNMLLVGNNKTGIKATSSPTVAYIHATSTTGTSTLPNLNVSGTLKIGSEYISNFTTYVRSLFTAGTGIAVSSGSISFSAPSNSALSIPYASSTVTSATRACLGTDCRTGWPTANSASSWATTTSQVAGRLINSSLNTTDIVTVGSNSTTTAPFYFDPNTGTLGLEGSKISTTTTVVCKQDSDCDYTSITAAIASGARDIFVKDGAYFEQVSMTNTKTKLRAQSLLAIISCNGTTQSPCVDLSDESTIQGFTINEVAGAITGVAINVSNHANTKVLYNRVNNFSTSTYAKDTANNTFYNIVEGNTFFDTGTCEEWSGTLANANWSSANRCRPMSTNSGGFGFYFADAWGVSSVGDDLESTTTNSTLTCAYVDFQSRGITFVNPWIEGCNKSVLIDAGARRTIFVGGNISAADYIQDNSGEGVFINTSDSNNVVSVTKNSLSAASSTSLFVRNTLSANSSRFGGTATSTVGPDGVITIVPGTAASPGLVVDGNAGLYSNGANILGLVAANAGISWDGTSFRRNTTNVADLGDLTHLWREVFSTTASTTNLIISSAGGTGTRCLQVGADGTVSANSSACGTGSGGANFTFGANSFATSTAATTTSILTQGVFFSSSTAQASVLPYASTTNISVSALTASRPVFTDANGGFSSAGTVGQIEAAVGSNNILIETEIDGCSELAALLDVETGGCDGTSGPVFPLSPVLNGSVAISTTTTRYWPLLVASSAAPQISLLDNTNNSAWVFRNQSGGGWMGTSTLSGATSTAAVMTFDRTTGQVAFPSSPVSGANQTYYACGSTTFGILWDTTTCLVSSLKYKRDITPINAGLAELMKLHPVNFYLKDPADKNAAAQQFGFIAEDVEKVDPRLITYETDGSPRSFRYENFTALLTKAIQELFSSVSKQDDRIQKLEEKVAALEAENAALKHEK